MATDVSNVTKHFPKPQPGFITTTSGPVSSAATTVGLNSVGNYSDDDVVVLVIDPADSDKKQVLTGTVDVSGSQLTGVVWVDGTNQSHASGATVVDYVTAAVIQMISKGFLEQHKEDGTHADTITTNTIGENTPGNGVTVDGLNVKDGKLNTAGSVVSSNITEGAVTPSKIDLDPGTNSVATSQSTSSATFTDLATAGPAVTAEIGANGLALVTINSGLFVSGSGFAFAGVAVSGASTVAASDADSVTTSNTAASRNGIAFLMSGLTPGSNTFTMKYKNSATSASFYDREINVVPL